VIVDFELVVVMDVVDFYLVSCFWLLCDFVICGVEVECDDCVCCE